MGVSRRRLLAGGGGLFLLALGGLGLFCASRHLPRPPRRVLVRKGPKRGEILVRGDFFLRLTPRGPLALWRRCPHLGCPVTYEPRRREFVCPCHQSRFSLEGRYLAGPARRDLTRLRVEETEGGLVVELPG